MPWCPSNELERYRAKMLLTHVSSITNIKLTKLNFFLGLFQK